MITQAKLKEILKDHQKWLKGDKNGRQANLQGNNLRDLNLCDVDLSKANLYCVDLRGAVLRNANLQGANLQEAKISFADLYGCNLCGTDLSHADLRGSDLSNVNFEDVNLCCANLNGVKLSEQVIQVGPVGSKKAYVIYFVKQDTVFYESYKFTLNDFMLKISKIRDTKIKSEYSAVSGMFQYLKMCNTSALNKSQIETPSLF